MVDTLLVDLGERSYPIHIGYGLLREPGWLRPAIAGHQVLILSNAVVAPLYLHRVRAALAGLDVDELVLPDGEGQKSFETLSRIMDFLLEHGHNRTTTLVALGGGVIGDLCGFAAAIYQRGVDFVQLPTTLLAQVDSSVGGKTAINHALGKNMIGAFHQPRAVLADLETLDSLPAREYAAGLAEVVKYGMIADATFFDWLEARSDALLARDPECLAWVVRRSCEIKAEVVAADEREGGRRAILNFGHSFGHALETLCGYGKLLHGEAVAIGMLMATALSVRQGLIDATVHERLHELLAALGLPLESPEGVDPQAMRAAMGRDKKVHNARLRLVLATGPGQVVVTDAVDEAALQATLAGEGRAARG